MKFIILSMCALIHIRAQPTYPNINISNSRVNVSEGMTYRFIAASRTSDNICTVSTIEEVKTDSRYGKHTAIYLRNLDSEKDDMVLRQNAQEILGFHALQSSLAKKKRTELYDARIRQFKSRKKNPGRFSMFGEKYDFFGHSTHQYDIRPISTQAYCVKMKTMTYRRKGLWFHSFADFYASKSIDYRDSLPDLEIFESRYTSPNIIGIVTSGIMTCAFCALACIYIISKRKYA